VVLQIDGSMSIYDYCVCLIWVHHVYLEKNSLVRKVTKLQRIFSLPGLQGLPILFPTFADGLFFQIRLCDQSVKLVSHHCQAMRFKMYGAIPTHHLHAFNMFG
jgi:hypothetical protein